MATNNTTLTGEISSSFFGNDTQLVGSDFKDPVLLAAIIVNGICAISFALLVIATWWIKRKKERGRRVFGVLSGIIVTMLLSYLRTTADEVILELNENKPIVNIALIVIEQVLSSGTDSALPFVVYIVIRERLSRIENNKERYSTVYFTHFGIAILLAAFRVVDGFLAAYGAVYIQVNAPKMAWGINISNWYKNIHLTYTTLFCTAALEMFACAVFIFKKSRPEITQSRSSNYLVAIVTPFLVIRSAVDLAFAIIYVYFAHNAQKSSGLINAILLGIPSVMLYLAMYVGMQQDGYGADAVDTQQDDGEAKQPFARTIRVG